MKSLKEASTQAKNETRSRRRVKEEVEGAKRGGRKKMGGKNVNSQRERRTSEVGHQRTEKQSVQKKSKIRDTPQGPGGRASCVGVNNTHSKNGNRPIGTKTTNKKTKIHNPELNAPGGGRPRLSITPTFAERKRVGEERSKEEGRLVLDKNSRQFVRAQVW